MRNHQYSSLIKGMYRRNASASFALASAVFLGLRSEYGRHLSELLRKGEFLELLNSEIKPSEYVEADSFRDDYLISSLLSKFPNFDVDIDKEKVAIDKFLEAERQCSMTNRHFGRFVSSLNSLYTVESFIWTARLKIASLLGPFNWDHAEQYFSFGPGSTTSLPKLKGDAYFKFGAVRPHVTKACSVLGISAIKRIPGWFSHLADLVGESPQTIEMLPIDSQIEKLLTIVPGNRVTTVPKNAKTDRVIAIEPDLNMYIQKGIGSLIRNRLRLVGIDLNDQSRNQSLAREGSLNGVLATIDLSSASDTVSMRLVEELLPADWVDAIKLTRSPRGVLPSGELITYQKVSSMGNGFTFELESLIFWALCSSVIKLLRPRCSQLSVYGDDIIISSEVYGTVSFLLSVCGFTVNGKKSFATGPFRESCGKHFFKGVDVTPVYIRKDIDSPERLIWFANSIRRWARSSVWGLDGRLREAYCYSVSLLPKALQKPSIPDGLGDIALMGDFDECRPQRSKHLFSWVAVGVGDIRPTLVPGGVPYLLRSLDLLERSGSELGASRGLSSGHKRNWKLIKVPVTRWESYGEWLTP